MENDDRYNNVGSFTKISSSLVKYTPGPEGLDYFKSHRYLLTEFKSRRLCYIPALAFKTDKDGNKYFIDDLTKPKPDLGYTAMDLYDICGHADVPTLLLFKLLNGAIPERFYKILIQENQITMNPVYMRDLESEEELYCKRSHPLLYKAVDVFTSGRTTYQCDLYWYKDPEMLYRFNEEWCTSIYNDMYHAWHLVSNKFFNKIPECRYCSWGYEILKSEIGESNPLRRMYNRQLHDWDDNDLNEDDDDED